MKDYKLDEEEKQILEDFEKGEFRSIKDFPKMKKFYEKVARNTLKKNKNINLRVTEKTYNGLKAKAIEEGIPYQTLAASVLHKYVNK